MDGPRDGNLTRARLILDATLAIESNSSASSKMKSIVVSASRLIVLTAPLIAHVPETTVLADRGR